MRLPFLRTEYDHLQSINIHFAAVGTENISAETSKSDIEVTADMLHVLIRKVREKDQSLPTNWKIRIAHQDTKDRRSEKILIALNVHYYALCFFQTLLDNTNYLWISTNGELDKCRYCVDGEQ
ncbi:unnamed protein product [Schistosoma mattheei]|uniref:Uncharacterized protein n=1 Tax=Schistosoma mattheei TaxID=31246 RepID=A0A183PJF7_9TREM|nr:unnamed protein product [Schistosoma mattheei]